MSIKLSKPAWFAVAVIVQMAIVVGLIAFNESMLIRGTQVLLPVHPYDPTDPLRGDYIMLTYDISSINVSLAADENKMTQGATVYVVLAKTGDHWEATGVKTAKPGSGELFIRGIVNYVDYDYSSTDWSNSQNTRKVNIAYGIENYFVPEGSGSGIVSQMRAKQALAQVVVDRDGNSVLKSIVFGGDIQSNASAVETLADNNQNSRQVANSTNNNSANQLDSNKYPNDEQRRRDIAAIQLALANYYAANGKYPISGGAVLPNGEWSTSNSQSWNDLQKELAPYLPQGQLPKDPVNESAGWPGDGNGAHDQAYAYYSQKYGCPQQWYMIVARYDDPGIASQGVAACDGTYFNYSGAVTVGVCKACGNAGSATNQSVHVPGAGQ